MVEYRTNQTGESDGSGGKDAGVIDGGIVDRALENAINHVRNDPKAQVQIAQSLQENYGIPPEVIGAFVGEIPDDTSQVPAPEQETPENAQAAPQIDASMTGEDLTADDVLGFLDEIADYTGEDTTVAELREFAEENPDVIETALSLKL